MSPSSCKLCGSTLPGLSSTYAIGDSWPYCGPCFGALRGNTGEGQEADTHTPGVKHDAGKPRVGLMMAHFYNAIVAVAGADTYGANKYTDHGWLEVPGGRDRYLDALLRHLLASNREELDPESGRPHLAHAAWNALAVLELHLRSKS